MELGGAVESREAGSMESVVFSGLFCLTVFAQQEARDRDVLCPQLQGWAHHQPRAPVHSCLFSFGVY